MFLCSRCDQNFATCGCPSDISGSSLGTPKPQTRAEILAQLQSVPSNAGGQSKPKPDTERPIKWRRVHEYANSPRPEPMLQQELYKLLSAFDALEAERDKIKRILENTIRTAHELSELQGAEIASLAKERDTANANAFHLEKKHNEVVKELDEWKATLDGTLVSKYRDVSKENASLKDEIAVLRWGITYLEGGISPMGVALAKANNIRDARKK